MLMSKYVRGLLAIVHKRLTEIVNEMLVEIYEYLLTDTTKLQRGSNHVLRSDL